MNSRSAFHKPGPEVVLMNSRSAFQKRNQISFIRASGTRIRFCSEEHEESTNLAPGLALSRSAPGVFLVFISGALTCSTPGVQLGPAPGALN
jgi:hypothetical protein